MVQPNPADSRLNEQLSESETDVSPADWDFWLEVLEATHQSQGDPEVLCPLLNANQERFSQLIRLPAHWVAFALPKLTQEQAVTTAGMILELSDWMQQHFPNYREIAIAGYGAALMVFDRQTFPQQWVRIQINLAISYRNHNLGNRAENLERAIDCYQSVLPVIDRTRSPEIWALVQANLAIAYIDRIRGQRTENLEQAIACCQRALEVYTQTDSPQDWAGVYNSLAVAYRSRIQGNRAENLEIAIECYQKALQVYTRKQFPNAWATTLSNLGNAYRVRLQGDRADNLEQAINCCEQALEVLPITESPSDWARTQRYLGNAYRVRIRGDRAANLERAVNAYHAALQGESQETSPQDWAMTQNELALVLIEHFRTKEEDAAADLEAALTCCDDALQVLTVEAFPEQRARVLNTLGYVYSIRLRGDRADNLERAVAAYQEALQFYTYETLPEQWARTQNNLGHALRERIQGERCENLEEAIAAYHQALRVYAPTTFPQNFIKTQSGLAAAYREMGQLQSAYEAFAVAIDRLEFLRSEITSGDIVKQRLAEEWSDLYQDMVKLCLERSATLPQYTCRALEYIERSKARNLVELLSQQEILPKGEISEAVIEELQYLRRSLAAEERSLQMAEAEDYSRFDQLRQQLDQFVEVNIKPIDPTFSATQKVDAITFAQIQALLNETTAALVWYVTEQDCFTWIVTRQWDIPQVVCLEIEERNALREWVNDYFQRYLQNKPDWQATLAEQLQALAKILRLEHILKSIPKDCNRLLLVPHRFLHLLPLHALPVQKLQGESHSSDLSRPSSASDALLDCFPGGVSYTPSFQALQLAQRRQRPGFSQFVGVQNPTGDLNYADVEVSVVGRRFQPTAEILMGEAAQKDVVSTVLQAAHCAHFACHGYFDFEFPLKSALVLAGAITKDAEQDEGEKPMNADSTGGTVALDKCLTLGEIFGLSLEQCRLVTLSACETGLTDFRSLTDEYVGLPSAFLYAGSPSVVSSLWAVNDISTALLMTKFYENLQTQPLSAVALNQAQRWLRGVRGDELKQWVEERRLTLNPTLKLALQRQFSQEHPFRPPYCWGAFCAIGQA